MSKRIFRSICLVSFAVLIVSLSLILGVIYNHFVNEIKNELRMETESIGIGVIQQGTEYLDLFSNNSKRITLIDSDGTVLYDNKSDPSKMENHLDREEIQEALKNGIGEISRMSTTLTKETMYCAMLLENGQIIRLSTKQYTLFALLFGVLQQIIAIIFFTVMLALFTASRVAKKIIEPINKIDLEHPAENQVYEEITPLLTKINKQNRIIEKQIAQAYEQQEEFNLITENMNEGFIIIDKSTSILSYNSAALLLLNAKKPDKNSSILTLNRSDSFRFAIENALNGNKTEKIMKSADKAFHIISSPVFNHGKVIGAVLVILDITEKEERENLRREFSANVSHELKTPLTSISGFAELIKNGMVSKENVVDFASSIYDEAQRLIILLNDIMNLSELDENAVPYEKKTVDLYKISQETVHLLSENAKTKNISLNIIGTTVEITGVESIVKEMIYNLCDNAIKYNKDCGSVDIIITQDESSAKISVKDTGIGIPAAHRDRVFERFYRVDKSHSKEIGGTGLGLSIVKHGAIFHNAEITLKSEENKGTTITITFPKQ